MLCFSIFPWDKRKASQGGKIIHRRWIRIIDFYYCLMTPAGGNVSSRFLIGKLRISYHRLLGIPKDDRIVYNNFSGNKVLLHLASPL